MRYWDTSALLKLYAFEPDAAYFLNLVANDARPLLTANIAREEMLCALYRKELSGDVKPGEARVLFNRFLEDERDGRIIVIPNGQDVLAEAERLIKRCYAQTPPLTVRSLDVIHAASALVSKADAVVATDARLRDAAGVMGLNVLPQSG